MKSNLIKLITTGVLCAVISSVYAQNNSADAKGFYGKKFTLQLGGGIHHNSILKLFSNYERSFSKNLRFQNYIKKNGKDQFNYSLYGSIGLVVKKRTSIALDFHYYFGNFALSGYGSKYLHDEYGNHIYIDGVDGRVKYNTMRIMPRLEINSNSIGSQIGLVHVFGLGVELSKAKSGVYNVMYHTDYDYITGKYNSEIISEDLKFINEFAFNVTFLYGMEYRIPISKNIGWCFGGYAHINAPISGILETSKYTHYGKTDWDKETKQRIAMYRLNNLFSVRTGLVIML